MGKHPIKILLKYRLPRASFQTMPNFYCALTKTTLAVDSLERNRQTRPWRMLIRKTFGKHLTKNEVKIKSMSWQTHFKRKQEFKDIVQQVFISRLPPIDPKLPSLRSASVKVSALNLNVFVNASRPSCRASSIKTRTSSNACRPNACRSTVDAVDFNPFIVRNVESSCEQRWVPLVAIKFQPPTIAY